MSSALRSNFRYADALVVSNRGIFWVGTEINNKITSVGTEMWYRILQGTEESKKKLKVSCTEFVCISISKENFIPEFKTFTCYCTKAMLLNIPQKNYLNKICKFCGQLLLPPSNTFWEQNVRISNLCSHFLTCPVNIRLPPMFLTIHKFYHLILNNIIKAFFTYDMENYLHYHLTPWRNSWCFVWKILLSVFRKFTLDSQLLSSVTVPNLLVINLTLSCT